MKKLSSMAVLLLLSICVFAQKKAVKFGDVPMEAMLMKEFPQDSSASAVVLGDFGSSTLSYSNNVGFRLVFERTTRIKILKKDGFDWANFEIPLYIDGTTDEKVVNLKAQTANLEGGKVIQTKVASESIFKEDVNENLRMVKVTFPNVKEGSVLDITYKINSEFVTNLQDWQFQYTIPVVVSEYRANIPEWFNYERYMQGYVILSAADEDSQIRSVSMSGSAQPFTYNERQYRWVAENVPAFRSEPYITTDKDYVSKINFELASTQFPQSPLKVYMGTWADINNRYAESANFLPEISGNGFLKKTVEEAIVTAKDENEKLASITNYVKHNYKWNGATRKIPSGTMKKVVETKQGTSADLNFLLMSMLEKAGFDPKPVLVSTRDHGFIRESIAISTQFNSVICAVRVGDKTMLLDATEPLLPVGVLPVRYLNGRGLMISKDGFQWIELSSPAKAKVVANVDFKIEPTGYLSGKLMIDRAGYSAQQMRTKYISKGETDYVKEISEGKTWQINKTEIRNVTEVNEPFREVYDMELDGHADVAGDVIYLNPFVMLREESNPFKLEKREYPVNFGTLTERSYLGKFSIPDGYTIDEIPKNKIIMLPGNAAKYSFSIAAFGSLISVTSVLQINRDLFSQQQYPDLREFFNQVVAKQSEQIVLKKKQQ